MKVTLTTRVSALEGEVLAIGYDVKQILAVLQEKAPAKAPRKAAAKKAQPKADDKPFVEWIRDTAEARAARKASNGEMATWMRSKGLVPNGAAWEAAKKGERNVRTLKALQAKDA